MPHARIPENPNRGIAYDPARLRSIHVAGGCFWGVEAYMARIPGVADAMSGYANGHTDHPTYEDVCRRDTGHTEAVHVLYDPDRVSLKTLLEAYLLIIDPTLLNRQGNDIGTQYRTGIYTETEADAKVAREVLDEERGRHSRRVVTELEPLRNWTKAEDYHQDYLEKNPDGYCHVDFGKLLAIPALAPVVAPVAAPTLAPLPWRRPTDAELAAGLTTLQVSVLRDAATEPPFRNEYWDEHRAGLYVDRGTGEPLFSSSDKFDSGCGWPSFTRPVDEASVLAKDDLTLGMRRTEVRSRAGDFHLGHVFDDGPKARGGLRYCINSAAVRFVPLKDMEREGYGAYRKYVES
jgi:peptide methionine sulfoxide reductase msrA/msrB